MMNHVYTPQIPKPFVAANVRQLRGRGPILEVGCHEGRNALYLADHGIEVVAIDIDEVALAAAAVRAKREGFSELVRFEAMDVRDVAGLDRKFGGVVCTEVIHDIPRELWGESFDAMAAVTQQGGLHVFSGYVNGIFGHDRPQALHVGEMEIQYEERGFDVIFRSTDAPKVHDVGMEQCALCSLERVVAEKL